MIDPVELTRPSQLVQGAGVYPGVVQPGGYQEGTIPGTYPAGQIEAISWNIEINRFIRPFD